MVGEVPQLTPAQFIATVNQALEYDFSPVLLVGEVASYKENQGKWVFFDLKDEEASVNCFMPLWQLRTPIEDGMKIVLRGVPKLTKWGKFSVTVQTLKPVGEGNLKKAFEMLKKKLAGEGLFRPERKRPIPEDLTELGVISSTGAAGYADFIKILNVRWGGIHVQVAHTQVQGLDAPDQMLRALQYFNERGEVQAIAMLRGGGSADDLACFNDETLVRAVAASRIPVITGVGHEVDESLCDLAADLRASTPSNAAELITRDRREVYVQVHNEVVRAGRNMREQMMSQREACRDKLNQVQQGLIAKYIAPIREETRVKILQVGQGLTDKYIEPVCANLREKMTGVVEDLREKYFLPALEENEERMGRALELVQKSWAEAQAHLEQQQKLLVVLNPEKVLAQGYAIVAGKMKVGDVVKITTSKEEAEAKVEKVKKR